MLFWFLSYLAFFMMTFNLDKYALLVFHCHHIHSHLIIPLSLFISSFPLPHFYFSSIFYLASLSFCCSSVSYLTLLLPFSSFHHLLLHLAWLSFLSFSYFHPLLLYLAWLSFLSFYFIHHILVKVMLNLTIPHRSTS